MQGKYTMKNGEKVEVLNFDADNNIAYVNFGSEKRWVGQCEYADWVGEDMSSITSSGEIEETKKKTRKKKDDTN